MTTFQIWQLIISAAGVIAVLIGALYAVITRPLLAHMISINSRFDSMQSSINSRLDSIDRRLDRIETRLDNIEALLLKHEERITRVEERTNPLRR